MRRINKVTTKDIQKVAKDIFQPEKLNLAIIGGFKDDKKFKKLLKF
jgi:predicted Zn-dependent peptidase